MVLGEVLVGFLGSVKTRTRKVSTKNRPVGAGEAGGEGMVEEIKSFPNMVGG